MPGPCRTLSRLSKENIASALAANIVIQCWISTSMPLRGVSWFSAASTTSYSAAASSILGSGVFDRHYTVQDLAGFVQDDYKFSDRLTFNLGLRYDYFGPPVDSRGRLVNFLPAQFRAGAPPNGIVQAAGGQLAGVPTVRADLFLVTRTTLRLGLALPIARTTTGKSSSEAVMEFTTIVSLPDSSIRSFLIFRIWHWEWACPD